MSANRLIIRDISPDPGSNAEIVTAESDLGWRWGNAKSIIFTSKINEFHLGQVVEVEFKVMQQ